jgi:hypothetical protein
VSSWRTRRAGPVGAAVLVVMAVVVVGLLSLTGNGSRVGARRAAVPPPATDHRHLPSLEPRAASFTPVPPVTVVPAQTSVEQSYDQALAQGLGSSSTVQAAEAASVPAPGYSGGWGPVPVTYDPGAWTVAFVQQLLDINFARQSRAGFGAWLSAEEAPELLPGVPVGIQNKVLYLSLFDTVAVGGGSSPLPSAAAWAANAHDGVVWSVSGVAFQPDPAWSQIVADGWQPVDERFGVEDVTGVLTFTQAGKRVPQRFSMTVYTGSAHWHHGYGTVLVSSWKEI